MVRVKDVAREAGVSVGTVSNVLNNRGSVASEYVERVNEAVERLGFVRNEAARSLRSGRSRVLGLLIPDGENPFYTGIARGAEMQVEPAGGIVLVGHTHSEPDRELHYLDAFTEQKVRGVILQSIGPRDDRIGGRIERLRSRGTPTVVLGRADRAWGASSIFVDDVAGGRLAAEHLVAAGRRRFVFVGGPLLLPEVSKRLEGTRLGGAQRVEVIETLDTTISSGREAGELIASRSKRDRPDGIFAANDLVALGLMGALAAGGIDVPRDISVIGYDDITFARLATPTLSSIRQPSVEVGLEAARMIDEEHGGSGPQTIQLKPELVVRRSTVWTSRVTSV